MREVEDSPSALGISLLVHAQNDLAVETAQQLLELLAHDLGLGPLLLLAETDTENLVAFFA